MKKYAVLFLMIYLLFACSDSGIRSNNPYLPNYSVLIDLNLNLAEYSNLKFVSNAVIIPTNVGVRGIVVFNSGFSYSAFDLACPNQVLSSCSTMNFKKLDPSDPLKIDKTTIVCPCDNAEYSLFSGQSAGKEYPLKQYRVQINGDVLRVYN